MRATSGEAIYLPVPRRTCPHCPCLALGVPSDIETPYLNRRLPVPRRIYLSVPRKTWSHVPCLAPGTATETLTLSAFQNTLSHRTTSVRRRNTRVGHENGKSIIYVTR
jgi:hypothetical protein